MLLRDTGAAQSLIHKKFCSTRAIYWQTYIVGVTGISETYPLAEVFVNCKWFSCRMVVGVVTDLRVDFLLGNECNTNSLEADITVGIVTRSKSKAIRQGEENQIDSLEAKSIDTSKSCSEIISVVDKEVEIPLEGIVDSKLSIGNDVTGWSF